MRHGIKWQEIAFHRQLTTLTEAVEWLIFPLLSLPRLAFSQLDNSHVCGVCQWHAYYCWINCWPILTGGTAVIGAAESPRS